MGIKTDISWADSSLNLEMGCDGCELWTVKVKTCYAGRLTERWGGRKGWPVRFDEPVVFEDRINRLTGWPDLTGKARGAEKGDHLDGLPRLVFLNDMGDTFTESLPIDWLLPFMDRLESSPHIYQILTKRPKRMYTFFKEYGRIPRNFWLGLSVTSTANISRIYDFSDLNRLNDAVKFLSFEPSLGAIHDQRAFVDSLSYLVFDWVIDGGESGPESRATDIHVFRGMRDVCADRGVAYFHKQNGGKSKVDGTWGGYLLDGVKHYGMPKKKAAQLMGFAL